MTESELAATAVFPYIIDNLGWPEPLVSPYGHVPVQVGRKVVWADYVCYVNRGGRIDPWLVIEVKAPGGDSLEAAARQAESYSLMLRAPYFGVTDGTNYRYYATGSSQGKSIELVAPPTSPTQEYLIGGMEYIVYSRELDLVVRQFITALSERKLLADTIRHRDSIQGIHNEVFRRVDNVSGDDLIGTIKDRIIMKRRSAVNSFCRKVIQDPAQVHRVLKAIRDEAADPEGLLSRLLDKKNEEYYIKGCGLYFITYLMAGAHPDEFLVIEERIPKALQSLGVLDVFVEVQGDPKGWVRINEICRKLYCDKIEPALHEAGLDSHNLGLVAVHNFLWHYQKNYRESQAWL